MNVQDLPIFDTLPISKVVVEFFEILLCWNRPFQVFFLLSVCPENQNLPTYSIKKWCRKKRNNLQQINLFSINKNSFE